MAKRDLLNLPDDLEGNLRKLLHTPPPPHDIPGSRKAAPKPVKRKWTRRAPADEPSQAELEAQRRHLSERIVKKLKEAVKPKARKAAKKR